MPHSPAGGATIPGVTHHTIEIGGRPLHHVTAGETGTPVLLVHGFPESWWAFRGVIEPLAAAHRVIAVDLPGFGDSDHDPDADHDSASAAESLRGLIEHLGVGSVHLTGQDIGGPTAFRLAAAHPELVRSFTGIETGLPGFGLEMLADVTHGGAWHVGVVAAPGIPELLLAGREREFLTGYAIPAMTADPAALGGRDVDELTRAYARAHGFVGAAGLYRSMLADGDEIRALVAARALSMPVLSVAAGSGPSTHETLHAVAGDVTEVDLDGIGHLAALEDPRALTRALLDFYARLDDVS